VDAYLDIAIAILRDERRPLSPQAILAAAYRSGLVPQHLHGKTQHKTLQARLSEDILERRDASPFFRTAPGRFFLREFLTDTNIPEEFRRPVPTRRRFRELVRGPALAIDGNALAKIAVEDTVINPDRILGLLRDGACRYDDPRDDDSTIVFVRSFVCVHRKAEILTYRPGRYRDDRDAFVSRRTIGFTTLVHPDEHTLFNLGDFGIVDSGVRAARIDLDVPEIPRTDGVMASLRYFTWTRLDVRKSDLLAVISFECPAWFEPTRRRLALNDLSWMDTAEPVVDIGDFDPWSRSVLLTRFNKGQAADAEKKP